jgi:hypothetical protein
MKFTWLLYSAELYEKFICTLKGPFFLMIFLRARERDGELCLQEGPTEESLFSGALDRRPRPSVVHSCVSNQRPNFILNTPSCSAEYQELSWCKTEHVGASLTSAFGPMIMACRASLALQQITLWMAEYWVIWTLAVQVVGLGRKLGMSVDVQCNVEVSMEMEVVCNLCS